MPHNNENSGFSDEGQILFTVIHSSQCMSKFQNRHENGTVSSLYIAYELSMELTYST